MAACWKRTSAGWVCFWTERTIASNDEFIDDQRAFTTTTIPSTGDFTNHKSMALTKGWADTKYTEIWKCASQQTAYNKDAVKGTEGNSYNGIVYQTYGNRVATDKKLCTAQFQWDKAEVDEATAKIILENIKYGYGKTLVAVYSYIASTKIENLGIQVTAINDALSLTTICAALNLITIAF